MAEIQGWECTIKADGTPKMYPAVLGTYVTRADYLAAVEKLEAEIKGYELQDGMLRKAYEDSGDAERFTWSGWLLKLVRDNAALEAEVQALREKLTQRSAPVSNEEVERTRAFKQGDSVRMVVAEVIANPIAPPAKEGM